MFVHIITKPLDLDQMRMEWTNDNSVVEKRLTEKLFSKQYIQ